MPSEPTSNSPSESASTPELDAVIIGAGFSGLYMLYRMRDVLGLSVPTFRARLGSSCRMPAA